MVNRSYDNFFRETLSFWRNLTELQRNTLYDSMLTKHFHVGESMRTSSDNCSGLFLLLRGQVRAYIVSENGKEITLYRLLDRDVCIFSASCMLKNITFDIYIEVEKETDAFLIPVTVFSKLSEESMAVKSFTSELMASRFSDVMWIMEQVMFMSFDKRLAIFIIEQSGIEESDNIVITHERIANHLGTAREVVSRMLKYFQNEGLIDLGRGSIKILDYKRLESIAN